MQSVKVFAEGSLQQLLSQQDLSYLSAAEWKYLGQL